MLPYIRFASTENILFSLKNENNNSFPSIEKDLFLKSKIMSCFEYLKPLFRQNRTDVNIEKTQMFIPISLIRKKIEERINDIKYTCETNTVEKQELFSNLIADIYTRHEGDKEAYCNENAYLFFNKMCCEGISKELIRIVKFYNCDNCNNHVVILYSSSPSLFNKIENQCNFDILDIDQVSYQSYRNLIDILIEAKMEDKKNQLFIIDPWSKDNKIIDLIHRDNDVYKIIKEKNHGVCIEREYLNTIIKGMLIESLASNDFNHNNQVSNSFSDFNDLKLAVSLDYPLEGSTKPPVPPKKSRHTRLC